MDNEEMVLLETCTDSIAAELRAGLLRSEAIPAVVRNKGPLPGLEPGAEVLVPGPLLARARGVLARQPLSDAELTELAIGLSPPPSQHG